MDVTTDDLEMLFRLVAALAAGALIGYERTYHGRPAGFRTHALVCAASSLLMLVTVYEAHWVPDTNGTIRLDPTRMAQGIMTGIGFLGAGVIMKEGIAVRGLTTAASIWITAAIGILAGIGFYFPLVVSVILTLATLSLFRWIEGKMPAQSYFVFQVRFARASAMTEADLLELIEFHGFSVTNLSYRLEGEGRVVRHNMVLRTTDKTSASRLADQLVAAEAVMEFRITPTGD